MPSIWVRFLCWTGSDAPEMSRQKLEACRAGRSGCGRSYLFRFRWSDNGDFAWFLAGRSGSLLASTRTGRIFVRYHFLNALFFT